MHNLKFLTNLLSKYGLKVYFQFNIIKTNEKSLKLGLKINLTDSQYVS